MLNVLANLISQTESADPVDVAPEYPYGDYFFPQQVSEFAPQVDNLYWAILWISTFFFALIIILMVYFAWKYRHRPGHEKALPSTSHNTPLEIIWSVIPSIILVWIFVTGATGYFNMKIPPDSAEEIWVTGKQFDWKFTYSDGDQTAKELHLVVNRPVKFIMESEDVLHSFFIPVFRQKQDLVPGRYTYMWAQPKKIGRFRIYCAEYCGEGHSRMVGTVVIHASEEDRKKNTQWIEADHTDEENGERLYKLNCAGCHNVNGVRSTGPALNGIWGKQEQLLSGSKLVDENYIRESILEPNKEIVSGFTKPSQMQSFQGKFSNPDEQIRWLIEFIKSIKDK